MVMKTVHYAGAAAVAAVCLGADPVSAFSPNLPLASRALPAKSASAAAMRRPAGILATRAAASLPAETVQALGGNTDNVALSGLNGLALSGIPYPTKREVYQAIPDECFKRDTAKSLMYAAISAAITFSCFATGFFIPLKLAMAPLWLLYSAVTGTVATGMWVVAHECGHGAFSDNKTIQDTVSTPVAPTTPPQPCPLPQHARCPFVKLMGHGPSSSMVELFDGLVAAITFRRRGEAGRRLTVSARDAPLAGRIPLPHPPHGSLLLVAALPRCAPLQD
jgi:hypothetical protein